jgi:chromosome partitioning protein
MTAKVVAVCNMKGGVGKTTVVVSLAETLAAIGANGKPLNVLVIDLDAQANASYSIAGDDLLEDLIERKRTIDVFFKETFFEGHRRHLAEFVRSNASALRAGGNVISLSLICSSSELRYTEREIIYALTRNGVAFEKIEVQVRDLMQQELQTLRKRFDLILIDCPPGISIFTEAVLKASDLVVAPVIPDGLSKLGLTAFCRRVLATPRRSGAQRLPWVLANRVQPTRLAARRLAEMGLESSAGDAGFRLFNTRISHCAALAQAMEYDTDAPTYATKYGTARPTLQNLAEEMLEILDAHG